MLKMILEYVSKKDLFKCRLVDLKMSGVSSEILANHSRNQIKFVYDAKTGSHYKTSYSYDNYSWALYNLENEKKKKNLSQFTKCFMAAKNFPYGDFELIYPNFDAKDLQAFLLSYGKMVKRLSIAFKDQGEFEKSFNHLKHLLIVQAPNIQHLSLQLDSNKIERSSSSLKLHLFPDETSVKLPCLKTLDIHKQLSEHYRGVVQDLLGATGIKFNLISQVFQN